FVANPNAITGEYLERETLKEIISKSEKLWVVDEAYNDFAGPDATMLRHVDELDNLVVTRTFSKTHALAGLRAGYLATSNAALMGGLMAHKDSYNEDALATRLAAAALEDTDWHRRILGAVSTGRKFLREELLALGFTVFASSANYLLAK